MVLDLHSPAGHGFHDLRSLAPEFGAYILSFTFLAIYWNNHHHLMQVVERISGSVLWANAHLLFWLSLTPFATAWLGSHSNDIAPAVTYGVVQLGAAIAFLILTRTLLAVHAKDSPLAIALGEDRKGKLSAAAYALAIVLAFAEPWLAIGIYVAVAIVWFIPDRRFERAKGTAVEGDRIGE